LDTQEIRTQIIAINPLPDFQQIVARVFDDGKLHRRKVKKTSRKRKSKH
jgi:hypothetical protein